MTIAFMLSAIVFPPPGDGPAEAEALVAEPEPVPPVFEPPAATAPPARRVPVWVWILLVAALIIVCVCCLCATLIAGVWATTASESPFRTSTPGIDTPITVEGVQVQLTSAARQDSYKSATGTHRPRQASDELLVIEATLSGATDSQKILAWKPFTVDDTGRKDVPGISTVTSDKDKRPTKAIWIIAVAKTARSFTFHLPGDKTVNLAPLLSR